MDTLYWLGEYAKVLGAFIFLMFVWPSVIFSKYLKGTGATYRFSFCVTVQVVLVTAVVLFLGVCQILYGWILAILFYGSFAWIILKKISRQQWAAWLHLGKRVLAGTYGGNPFWHDLWNALKRSATEISRKVCSFLRPNWLEYAILGAIIVYGMVYVSYGAFQNYGYGFGDMYVHNQWIDAMLDGDIFYAGIYPRGMHCIIYSLHVLFGIELYSCIQLLAGAQIIVTLLAIYIFLRYVFRWKYTPLLVLTLFLVVDVLCVNEVYSVARLQWAVPQEFGMYAQFLSALFLVRFLKSSKELDWPDKGAWRGLVENKDLFIFEMAVLAATVIHFYCTIFAFLLCVPFAVFNLRDLFKWRKLLSLVLATVLSISIAVLPMIAAFLAGVPLQGSMYWALSIIQNGEAQSDEADVETDEFSDEQSEASSADSQTPVPAEVDDPAPTLAERLKNVGDVLYWHGYVELYRQSRARYFIAMTVLAVFLWAIYRLIWLLPVLRRRRPNRAGIFDTYLPIIAGSVLFMVLYVASYLNLPQVVSGTRVPTIENLLLFAVTVMPADMLFTLLSRVCPRTILQIASVASVAGTYLATILTGTYHGFLLHELTRYNAEVIVTESIINNFPPNTYTIVATTSELYQVNRFGRHEELLKFVQDINEEEYVLPTEYVFLFVEKRPLEYAQFHFYDGPEWLGNGKYMSFFGPHSSEGADVNASVISAEAAETNMPTLKNGFAAYNDINNRTILMSKVYLWCQNFLKLFPNEMGVYYEDDNFVCYYFKQNPESLYNLAIEDWESTDGIDWNIEVLEEGVAKGNVAGGLA